MVSAKSVEFRENDVCQNPCTTILDRIWQMLTGSGTKGFEVKSAEKTPKDVKMTAPQKWLADIFKLYFDTEHTKF